MTDSPFPTVAVIGAGVMGREIAQLAAQAGSRVLLHDAREEAAAEAKDFIAAKFARAAEKGRLAAPQAEAYSTALHTVADISALDEADLVIEAVVEDLDVKQQLLVAVEAVVKPDAVLATNTSSLSVTRIAAGLKRPSHLAGLHFFNPAPLMKVVEVVPGARTKAEVVEKLRRFVKSFGHLPVEVKDTPGFLVNHAGRAYSTEALRILSEGVAPPATIDRILREGLGFRMGPFELMDLTGLDVSQPVMEQVYNQFFQDDRYRPSAIAAGRLAGGLLGRKSGEGFYRYDGETPEIGPPARPPLIEAPKQVWVQPGETKLHRWLAQRGIAVFSDRPPPNMLCLVTPIGYDCTMELARHSLDPSRTLAVDVLCGFATHRTIMTNPATQERYRDQAWALLALDGTPVSVIRDSPGFVGQRVAAQIVNIGCEIAQQGIAAPHDIDSAVKLGLGYPKGPLELGEELGTDRTLYILDALQEVTGDPRYRAALWLRRRSFGTPLHKEELSSP